MLRFLGPEQEQELCVFGSRLILPEVISDAAGSIRCHEDNLFPRSAWVWENSEPVLR